MGCCVSQSTESERSTRPTVLGDCPICLTDVTTADDDALRSLCGNSIYHAGCGASQPLENWYVQLNKEEKKIFCSCKSCVEGKKMEVESIEGFRTSLPSTIYSQLGAVFQELERLTMLASSFTAHSHPISKEESYAGLVNCHFCGHTWVHGEGCDTYICDNCTNLVNITGKEPNQSAESYEDFFKSLATLTIKGHSKEDMAGLRGVPAFDWIWQQRHYDKLIVSLEKCRRSYSKVNKVLEKVSDPRLKEFKKFLLDKYAKKPEPPFNELWGLSAVNFWDTVSNNPKFSAVAENASGELSVVESFINSFTNGENPSLPSMDNFPKYKNLHLALKMASKRW